MKDIRDLRTIESECRGILESLGINPGKVCSVSMQNNPKARESCCIDRGRDGFEIRIDDIHLREELTEHDLMCAMLHELLHTVPGCFNHRGKWAEYAKLVTEKTEFDLLRIDTGTYAMLHPDAEVLHKVVCPQCGSYALIKSRRIKWRPELPGGGKLCRCGAHMETVF